MTEVHETIVATESTVEVDYFAVYGDGEIFLEVHDSSYHDGSTVKACAILTPKKARRAAKALLAAAKAASE